MSGGREKPQLHTSGLDTLSRCGEQFRRRYIEGEIIPPAVAMIVGTATDRSITRNLQNKIDLGVLLAPVEAVAIAHDALAEEWERGVLLDDDERREGAAKVREGATEKAVRLARLHAEHKAPTLEPTHVQRGWVVELGGYPLDLAGTTDIEEGHDYVRDTKTSKKSPAKDAADTSTQLTTYALAHKVLDGQPVAKVALDYLVDLKRGPALRTLVSTRNDEDFAALLRRVENAVECLDKGVFVPARETDWWCSRKWCGYHVTCPYARDRTTIALNAGG